MSDSDDDTESMDSTDSDSSDWEMPSQLKLTRTGSFGSGTTRRIVVGIDNLRLVIIFAWLCLTAAGLAIFFPFVSGLGYSLPPLDGTPSRQAEDAFEMYFPDSPVPGALLMESVGRKPFLEMRRESSCELTHNLTMDTDGALLMSMRCVNEKALGNGCITKADLIAQATAISTKLLRAVSTEEETDRIIKHKIVPDMQRLMPEILECPYAVDDQLTRDWLNQATAVEALLDTEIPACKHTVLSFVSIPDQPFSSHFMLPIAGKNMTLKTRATLPAGSFWTLFKGQLLAPGTLNSVSIMESLVFSCNGKPVNEYGETSRMITSALEMATELAPKTLRMRVATANAAVDSMHDGIELTMGVSSGMVPLAFLIVAYMVKNPRLVICTMASLTASLALAFLLTALVSAYVIEVSMFAPALIMAVALAMSIDYSLFLLTRFQREIDAHTGIMDSVTIMMRTSGRIVMVSGTILFLCFASIGIIPGDIIKSMGAGGAIGVLSTVASSLTLIPAMLLTFREFFLGRKGACRGSCMLKRKSSHLKKDASRWAKFGKFIQKRSIAILLLLVSMAVPIAVFSFPHYKVSVGPLPCMPGSARVSQTVVAIGDFFGIAAVFPNTLLIVPHEGQTDTPKKRSEWNRQACAALLKLADDVNVDPHVPPFTPDVFIGQMILDGHCTKDEAEFGAIARWSHVGRPFSATEVRINYRLDPFSPQGQEWVARMRKAIKDHWDVGEFYFHGQSGNHLDYSTTSAMWFKRALAIMMGVVFVFMGMMSQSVVAPVRALLCLVWMLAISMGLLIIYFQLEDGSIYWLAPIIGMPVMIGLGLDYDIFYTEAVVENVMNGYPEKMAAIIALTTTADTITAAGLIMVISFLPLFVGSTPILKEISFMLIVGVLVDCFVSTKIVVPDSIALLRGYNFWPRDM